MEYTLFTPPIQSEKMGIARAFLEELEQKQKADYATSEKRLGITKEIRAVRQRQESNCSMRRSTSASG